MRSSTCSALTLLGMTALSFGCGDKASEHGSAGADSLVVALSSYSQSDVTAVRFDVVAADASCADSPVASETVALMSAESDRIEGHSVASSLLLLSAGTYRVCATPLAGDAPSTDCAKVDALANVVPEQTTELMLISQCQGDPTGGVSPVVSLNKPPRIQKVTVAPSKLITVCETLTLGATATDPEGDALSYSWTLLAGSPDAHLRGIDASATFSGPAGDYLLQLSVVDVHQGRATLTLPVHVSDATCTVPQNVEDIFLARCTPCHTTNPVPSAGMSLATPLAAYQNLVQHQVAGAACTNRVRVIPGDSASSYIIAKLHGEAGICGLQMPRNRPPLPDSEIQTIAAWIDSLPH